jgi:hypothetical protein
MTQKDIPREKDGIGKTFEIYLNTAAKLLKNTFKFSFGWVKTSNL